MNLSIQTFFCTFLFTIKEVVAYGTIRYKILIGVYMIIYVTIILIMSVITYFAYAIDKKKSIQNKQRISEKSLFMLSILFGALGGILAMHFKRHKTKHFMFHFVNWLSLILHIYLGYLIDLHQLLVI